MSEWVYRATASKADWGTTDDLLTSHGFLCRPAYAQENKQSGVHQLVANVRDVKAGDVLHVAFTHGKSKGSTLEGIGSFEILDAPHKDLENPVDDGRHGRLSIFCVRRGSPLEETLEQSTYTRDSKLGVFTGWHVREIEYRDVQLDRSVLRRRHSIQPYPQSRGSGIGGGVADAEFRPVIGVPRGRIASPSGLIALPKMGRFLGVDWSGSARAGRKIWTAVVEFDETHGARLLSIDRPFSAALGPGEVSSRFANWLGSAPFDAAGLDFCFGVAREHSPPDMPLTGPSEVGGWLGTTYPTPESFKAALGPERKRATDRIRRSPFAPTNLRMFRQTYWGLRALARLTIPILPWGPAGKRVVIEVLPADVAAALAPGCRYKGRTADARAERQRLLQAVVGTCRLTVATEDERSILEDDQGDAMDALLAAVAAASAQSGGFQEGPADAATSGEGWIYSVIRHFRAER